MTDTNHDIGGPSTQLSNSLGLEMRQARKERGLLVREAAADLGIDPSVLSKYENGHVIPSDESIEAIASYYLIETSELRLLAAADKFIREQASYEDAAAVSSFIRERLASYFASTENKKGELGE